MMVPFLLLLLCFGFETESLCSPGQPRTHYVDHVDLELTELASKMCTNHTWPDDTFKKYI